MTVKVTFYVGLNDKDAKVQLIDSITASRIVERVFSRHEVDGATTSFARGIYKHDDGTMVAEETILVQVFEFGEPINVAAICEDLKRLLNQESIAVEKQETDSQLY